MGENKESNFVHESEFDRWAEAWEIDTDVDNMTEEDRDGFRTEKGKLIKAMKRGRLVYDDDKDVLIYTTCKKDEPENIEIARPKGDGLMAMDKYKDREGVHKTYAVLGQMTKKSPAFFSGLDGIDLKPFLSVVSLFLAS